MLYNGLFASYKQAWVVGRELFVELWVACKFIASNN